AIRAGILLFGGVGDEPEDEEGVVAPPISCQTDLETWQHQWPELVLPVLNGSTARRRLSLGVTLWAATLPEAKVAIGNGSPWELELVDEAAEQARLTALADIPPDADEDEAPAIEPHEYCPPMNAVSLAAELGLAITAKAGAGAALPAGENFAEGLVQMRHALDAMLPKHTASEKAFLEAAAEAAAEGAAGAAAKPAPIKQVHDDDNDEDLESVASEKKALVPLAEVQRRGCVYFVLHADADAAFNEEACTYSFAEGTTMTQAEIVEYYVDLCAAEPLLKLLVVRGGVNPGGGPGQEQPTNGAHKAASVSPLPFPCYPLRSSFLAVCDFVKEKWQLEKEQAIPLMTYRDWEGDECIFNTTSFKEATDRNFTRDNLVTTVFHLATDIPVCMGVASILWFLVLFSCCFGVSVGFFGNPATYGLLNNVYVGEPLMREGEIVVDGIPGLLFCVYQSMFAVITPALMTGAFADRFRFKSFLIFITMWLFLVYAPVCHWVWGGGWLAQWGVFDFAGGLVVHVTCGFSALATLLVVGKRHPDGVKEQPHNVPFVALGTALLWFGWFGFNGGSAFGANRTAVAAVVNSEIAASVCLCGWILIDWLRKGKPSLVGLCVGAIAGLATVTPAAGYVQPWGALVLGVMAAPSCYLLCDMITRLGMDDALDVWAVHGMGGFLGSVMVGALADPVECAGRTNLVPSWCSAPNTVTRSWEQFGKQLAAAIFVSLWSLAVTYILLKAINLVCPIMPCPIGSSQGLDRHEHGEQAYSQSRIKAYPPEHSKRARPEASQQEAMAQAI
ncbi:unnamed protein product, partial [Polarella glacialis]